MRIGQRPLGTPLNNSHPLSNGLMLHLPMNEGGGKILTNVAGNRQYNGVINGTGTNWQPGLHGKGFEMNNTDDYISSSYTSTTLMTVSFWLRLPTAPAATNNTGIFFWNGFSSVDGRLSCEISGPNPNIFINKANQANFRGNTSATVLKDGFWHHVVFAIDKASASASDIYIDGTVITYTTTADQTFNTDAGFLTRFVIVGTSRFGIGIYNDIKIWNRKLSYTEVRQLYKDSYQMFYEWKRAVPIEFINKYKFNNRGIRPRPFAPGHAR